MGFAKVGVCESQSLEIGERMLGVWFPYGGETADLFIVTLFGDNRRNGKSPGLQTWVLVLILLLTCCRILAGCLTFSEHCLFSVM